MRELDSILNSTGRKLLDNAGTISSTQAQEKAKQELQRYKAITLDQVEKDYLKTISSLEKRRKRPPARRETSMNEMSPLNPKYLTMKQSVFQKIAAFVEKFKGVGGEI